MAAQPLSDAELNDLEALTEAASPAPWRAFAGPGIGGPAFVALGDDDALPDMYVQHHVLR